VTAPVIAEGRVWKLVLAGFGSGPLIAGLYAARPGKRSLILSLREGISWCLTCLNTGSIRFRSGL
jgi:hypothetical protein